MFLDLFIIPKKNSIDQQKADRIIQSSKPLIKRFWHARTWKQINDTRKTCIYYGVVYDNEWFDQRLIKDLRSVLLFNLNIDMFSLFLAHGGGEVRFEPRIFSSRLSLNPDISGQPLPYDHQKLRFEKLIGGWLYVD